MEVVLTDIAARQPSADRRFGRLRAAAGRCLAGASAAGIAVGLVLTGTATGSAAPTEAGSGHPARVITLTSNTSSSAGQLTMRFSYQPGKGGSIKPVSLSFSGGSPLKLAHPALVFSFRPVPAFVHGKPGKVKARPSVIIIGLRDLRHFSVKLPLKALPRIDWKFKSSGKLRVPPTALLQATVASVSPKRPVSISAPVGLQVGIVLGPIAFGPGR
jgi:hypothetical protein